MKALPISIQGRGYFGRMSIYFREMYALPKHLVSAVLMYLSFTILLRQNFGVRVPFPSLYSLIGSASLFLFLLILRLMDELKDREIDLQLFRTRPVPSGRVLESDIRWSLALCTVAYIVLNAFGGKSFWMSLVLLGYGYLMFKYFFIPNILRKYLTLNLISHNPVVALMFFYLVVLFGAEQQIQLGQMDWRIILMLCLMYWSMAFAWEIARKIRSDVEENAYVTYSRLFGKRGAVTIAAAAQTLTFAIALFFAFTKSSSFVYVALCSVAYIGMMISYIRFLLNPNPATSRLKPWAEAYMLSIALASCCEFVFARGIQ